MTKLNYGLIGALFILFCFLEYCNLSVDIADNDEGDDCVDSGSISIKMVGSRTAEPTISICSAFGNV